MFKTLVDGFSSVLNSIKGKASIQEKDLDKVILSVKESLLEADVHYDVVEKFLEDVKTKAIGKEIHKALSPAQEITKIINSTLVELLGRDTSSLSLNEDPSIIMLVGLQGSGKTTSSVKLAKYLKDNKNKNPLLVGIDFNRPAAVEQLEILSSKAIVDFYKPDTKRISKVLKNAKKQAQENSNDVIIIDTAGRLHIDKDLMNELKDVKKAFKPSEILLVADSMLGRDAVNVAKEFDETLSLTGFILSKLDSDTRGGVCLSLNYITKKPIKFMGLGEKIDEFEVFHPDRVVSRILDFGDMMTLIEKAERQFDEKEKEKLEKKLKKNQFDIEDFLSQIKQIKKMGSVESLMSMIPGVSGMMSKVKNLAPPDEELKKIEAIIQSMTKYERQNPSIIKNSRRQRIAKGSGTNIKDVNKFLKQFDNMKKMMKNLPKSGISGLSMFK